MLVISLVEGVNLTTVFEAVCVPGPVQLGLIHASVMIIGTMQALSR